MADGMVRSPPHCRMNERKVVDYGRDLRENLRHPLPALPILLEGPRAFHERAWIALPDHNLTLAGQRLAMVLFQHRLVIEGVNLTHAAGHKQRNNGLRLRLEMGLLRQIRRVLCIPHPTLSPRGPPPRPLNPLVL